MNNIYLILSTVANLVLIFLWIGESRDKKYYYKCFTTWRGVAEESDQEAAKLLQELNEIRATGMPAAMQRQIENLETDKIRLQNDLVNCKAVAQRLSLENSRFLRGINQAKTGGKPGKL